MYGEIITIGDELISGNTLDLNSSYAAARLTASGFRVRRITSVGDDYQLVPKALSTALKTSRFVIVTGGLGPTDDDVTNEIVADVFNRSLCLDPQMFDRIKSYVEAKGLEMTPALEKMAWMPEGSRVIDPDIFMCGCCIEEQDVHLYFLPGVPEQMRHLFDKFVLPELLDIYNTLPAVGQNILKLYGIKEPDIAEILKELQGNTGDVVLGYYPQFPENHITLSLQGKNEQFVAKELERVETDIRRLLGSFIFSSGKKSMEEIVGQALLDRAMTISVAESCTGGLIGHRLTNVPGSSGYFQGGVVVYSNESKAGLINVNPETLKTHGAVSTQTVKEMAQGVKNRFGTDLGLAVSGIAGPDGGSRERPVGTVHIGLAAGGHVLAGKYLFWGDREQVKLETSTMALDWIRRYLNEDSFLPGI